MDNNAFIVSFYPARASSPWKLEIRARFAGKKIRRFFKTEDEAWGEGERLTGQIRERGVSSVQFDGVSVSGAIRRFWAKRGASLAGRHGNEVRAMLGLFEGQYGRLSLKFIGPNELHDFWNREEWPDGKSSRRRAFSCLRIFFNWCERFELIDKNPIRRVDVPKKPKPLNHILEPEQMEELLEIRINYLRAFICLGGFAGLRASEARRIDSGADLDWKNKEIRVSGDSKTGERYVKMTPAFIRHCPRTFKFPNCRNFYEALRREIKKLGWGKWPQNILRHTYATYLLAKTKDAPLVAHEMGHRGNPEMVNNVYALRARRAKQEAFWKL